MRKTILLTLLCVMSLGMKAQTTAPVCAFFSLEKVVKAMPDYAIAQRNINELQAKYDEETKRSEDEFNKKYEEFIDVQNELAPSIRNKRQAELKDMIEKNVAFKAESVKLMQQASAEAMQPLREKVGAALSKLAAEKGYIFVLNTDNDAVPYINPSAGEDITDTLINALR